MKKKKRIELIDLVKAVTIFLVILGHTTGNLETPLYRRIMYSFHMPLFFSGWSFHTSGSSQGLAWVAGIFEKEHSGSCGAVSDLVVYLRTVLF